MRHCVKAFFSVLFLLMIHHRSTAQHYFFVEAEGGQAFYMRIYDTLYSSTGEGFLIIPKVSDSKVSFSIGFPRGLYPEANFELNGMETDKGFLLKHEGNVWLLLDRQKQEKYYAKISGSPANSTVMDTSSSTKASSDFANMLSEVTADKSLIIEKNVPVKTQVASKLDVQQASPQNKDTAVVSSPVVKELDAFIPAIIVTNESRTSAKVEKTYVDKWERGKADSIEITIDIPAPTQTNSDTAVLLKPSFIPPSINQGEVTCIMPEATIKDIRNIQKKLLGQDTEADLLNFVEKIYKSKCFTVEQTKEVGWILRDETMRLTLFKRILPFIADKSHIADLGVAFFKDENVKAFKALISQ